VRVAADDAWCFSLLTTSLISAPGKRASETWRSTILKPPSRRTSTCPTPRLQSQLPSTAVTGAILSRPWSTELVPMSRRRAGYGRRRRKARRPAGPRTRGCPKSRRWSSSPSGRDILDPKHPVPERRLPAGSFGEAPVDSDQRVPRLRPSMIMRPERRPKPGTSSKDCTARRVESSVAAIEAMGRK
jgi:hypothetical protein